MEEAIKGRYPASGLDLTMQTFPADGETDPAAYLKGGYPCPVTLCGTLLFVPTNHCNSTLLCCMPVSVLCV